MTKKDTLIISLAAMCHDVGKFVIHSLEPFAWVEVREAGSKKNFKVKII